MSAKTMDIDLDAGEEVEVQWAEEAGDAPKRNRSGGIGLVASGIRNVAARRQRSIDGRGGNSAVFMEVMRNEWPKQL